MILFILQYNINKNYKNIDIDKNKMNENINIIKDIRLKVSLRVGSKLFLLRDIVNMDIVSVIELDQLVNDPLEILVENKVVALGEVIIIDGNFGVQISKLINQGN